MKSTFIIVYVLITILSCFHTLAQSVYKPISLDSNALNLKQNYLGEIKNLNQRKSGPNIIIILADDLGKNDINVYSDAGVQTPNISQLAKEGVIFTDAYSTSSVCNPSRAGLITGRYQQRFGNELQIMSRYAKNKLELFLYKNFVNTKPMYLRYPWFSPPKTEVQKQGLPESEISLFELMHSAGYRTGCIGKWHLGYNEPFLPQNKSVDEFYGFYEAFSLYAPETSKEIVNYHHKIFQEKHIWRQKRKGPCAIMQNGEEVNETKYLTTRIAEKSCQFIKQNKTNPFFLYVSFSAPHTPFQAPRSYYDKFDHIEDKNKRVYYAMIAALDEAIGDILDQVNESGIEENTLIFFASDNGGATYTGATDNGDLNGGKITHFEGGLNVPFVMKWKGKITPGIYHHPVSLMDIFVTTASSCALPTPDNIAYDGVNLVPYLTGKNTDSPHEYLFWRTEFNKTVRNDNWKLLVNERDNLVMLFDLKADKQERYNLKDEYPERIDILLTRLSEWESEMKPPAWPGVMEYEEEINGVKLRFAF